MNHWVHQYQTLLIYLWDPCWALDLFEKTHSDRTFKTFTVGTDWTSTCSYQKKNCYLDRRLTIWMIQKREFCGIACIHPWSSHSQCIDGYIPARAWTILGQWSKTAADNMAGKLLPKRWCTTLPRTSVFRERWCIPFCVGKVHLHREATKKDHGNPATFRLCVSPLEYHQP